MVSPKTVVPSSLDSIESAQAVKRFGIYILLVTSSPDGVDCIVEIDNGGGCVYCDCLIDIFTTGIR